MSRDTTRRSAPMRLRKSAGRDRTHAHGEGPEALLDVIRRASAGDDRPRVAVLQGDEVLTEPFGGVGQHEGALRGAMVQDGAVDLDLVGDVVPPPLELGGLAKDVRMQLD